MQISSFAIVFRSSFLYHTICLALDPVPHPVRYEYRPGIDRRVLRGLRSGFAFPFPFTPVVLAFPKLGTRLWPSSWLVSPPSPLFCHSCDPLILFRLVLLLPSLLGSSSCLQLLPLPYYFVMLTFRLLSVSQERLTLSSQADDPQQQQPGRQTTVSPFVGTCFSS